MRVAVVLMVAGGVALATLGLAGAGGGRREMAGAASSAPSSAGRPGARAGHPIERRVVVGLSAAGQGGPPAQGATPAQGGPTGQDGHTGSSGQTLRTSAPEATREGPVPPPAPSPSPAPPPAHAAPSPAASPPAAPPVAARIAAAEQVAGRFAAAFVDGPGGVTREVLADLVTPGLLAALEAPPASAPVGPSERGPYPSGGAATPAVEGSARGPGPAAGSTPWRAAPAGTAVVRSIAVEDLADDHIGLSVTVWARRAQALDVKVVSTPAGWRVARVQL